MNSNNKRQATFRLKDLKVSGMAIGKHDIMGSMTRTFLFFGMLAGKYPYAFALFKTGGSN